MRIWTAVMVVTLAACGENSGLTVPQRPVVVEFPQPVAVAGTSLFPGTVVAREEAALGFRIGGKLVSREVDAGDQVKAGQLLARIDPEDTRLASNAAQAAVTAAEADLRLAEAELERYRGLLERNFISASAFELRENTYKLAMARLDQAKAEHAVSRNQRRYTDLTADRDGLITRVLAEPGQVLTLGQPVLQFVPDESREVEVQVPEGRLDGLRQAPGLQVRLWALPASRYTATVREISPQADQLTRTHRVRLALVDADDRVRLGMTASAFLQLGADRPLFGIPSSALGELDGTPVVWQVDENDTVHPLSVEVDRYTEQGVVVAGDLGPDRALVSAGVHLLSPGQAVTVIQRQRAER
ncbi:efflux RND transporter periplasmic adaptor subunit [Flagellatimonas centrodinii]|uniref:efflux RND transporter periplasmic adaptor subunit n=1 Tax=Flagellatimonas centrodinii TaxID=2806210 RepID=UPI001FFCB352|nr:efflux RND transporter periplasmic adaptor subunit [Flagellatimonas centrodinii]ULQ45531.1 efflux RND transporter periplasmic adaptor subunit [Flagellatimonas centrodinii]